LKSYIFSLFSRFFLALSGFVVFVVTAALFGANGRGTIGYGTSFFAIIGLILSLNLGRAFLGKTKQDLKSKERLLSSFLILNIFLSLISAIAGIVFWNFSPVAQQMLTGQQVWIMSFTSFFYVWSVNGNAFYASFILTHLQEKFILTTRMLLMAFLGLLYILKSTSIDQFLIGYSILLFLGTLGEIGFLFFSINRTTKFDFKLIWSIVNEAKFHHLDYLAFNLFPLLMTVFLASYEEKGTVGKFNFTLQLVNLVFLFSMTANIRISSYVSDVGFKARLSQCKKLLWGTLLLSFLAAIGLYFVLIFSTRFQHLSQFEGVQSLFLIITLSIPGYLLYQFFNPIWIDLRKQQEAAFLHASNLLIFALISHWVLKVYGIQGAVWLIVFFHWGLILSEYLLFLSVFSGSTILSFVRSQRGSVQVETPQSVV
jgi:hypothetical protein